LFQAKKRPQLRMSCGLSGGSSDCVSRKRDKFPLKFIFAAVSLDFSREIPLEF
jgi:hypothetical protein